MSTSGLQENVEQVAARTAPTRRRVPRVVRLVRCAVSMTGHVTENLARQGTAGDKTGHVTDDVAPQGLPGRMRSDQPRSVGRPGALTS